LITVQVWRHKMPTSAPASKPKGSRGCPNGILLDN
jgi:hypothetical protein